ncbi:aminotransferase class V-fold PLP-dependent enzyme [Nocardia bhagyanarayanae]|uniref:Selenocysteine lyase/cysteine desulfurase n=1 Tax=Nocardia bhagyanarayanae TaxID=1215925 RepID=A0A543FB40_9NOCA|nr:aminotransferase class V-fold PLP-dependent enzyme [Nocardia bhagyanarayanae]TQM31057.1 selenocysteine lyase/cysteine desulfurase [Nocardia bhagyanarayanae]
MKPAAYEEFDLAPGLIQLNHASYGLASRTVADAAVKHRHRIESDPTRFLGAELTEQLRDRTALVCTAFGLTPEHTTLCSNATSGAAAIIASLPLTAADTVVVLDTEYSSINRAWQLACGRAGARYIEIAVPLPFRGTEALLSSLEAEVPGPVSYLQASLVSSSAALWLPVAEIAQWVRGRGGHAVLDAAHGPGHIRLTPDTWGAAAMFGTLHKWLPTERSVGFLWLTEQFVHQVRPAEVSLTWDSADLVERFSWPGTFDPVPRLCLGDAIAQWHRWDDRGLLTECEKLADHATSTLTGLAARPTAEREYLPPRLRSFILEGVTVAEVKTALSEADIRTWVGPGPSGECLLRIATHVYNDRGDIAALAARLEEVLHQ